MRHTIFFASMDCLPRDARIRLFGAGEIGRAFAAHCLENRPDIRLLGFMDTYKKGTVDGVPVVKPSKSAAAEVDYLLIATPAWHALASQLLEIGIENFAVLNVHSLFGERRPIWVYSVPSKKLIYVRNPKVASSSIIRFLEEMGSEQGGTFSDDERLTQFFSFTLVRNPFERVVSVYNHFFCGNKSIHAIHALRVLDIEELSFEQFVEYLVMEPNWAKDGHWKPQHYFVPGRLSMISRLEEIDVLVKTLERKIGMKITLPQINCSPTRSSDYRRYYTGRTRSMVEEVYGLDLHRFQYDF